MAVITYKTIQVDGIPFTKIQKLTIDHGLNQHATATIIGEVDYDAGKDCLSRMDETTGIMISTTSEGQPAKLFCGVVSTARLEHETAYATMYVELLSASALLDIQKKKKSFQNTGKTYEQIINDALEGSGTINFAVSDKPIGNLIMQYGETNWEFILRMANVFNAPVVPSIHVKKPYVTIGMPSANRTVKMEGTKKSIGVGCVSLARKKQNGLPTAGSQSNAASGAFSYEYGYIGDNLAMDDMTLRISGVHAVLEDGILKMQYECNLKSGGSASGGVSSAVAGASQAAAGGASGGSTSSGGASQATGNKNSSGKMFTGKVMAVNADKVQVHLLDIDPSYDGGGSHWFPYSTLYSSQDESGFYCMPEVGDTVRVFFPSNNEGEAFAASSVNVSPLDNVKHKKWRTPGGKEILMTEEGLYITCKENKIYINLEDANGISIYSEKDVNILSTANITINAKDKLTMHAENNMYLGTGETSIEMTKDKIALSGENVVVN